MMIFWAQLLSNPTKLDKVMGRTQICFNEDYAQSLRANFDPDFDLAAWSFFRTHHLNIMIICAKLFSNPTCMTQLWAGHKQVSLKPMHKVKVRAMTLTFNLAICFCLLHTVLL